MTDSPISAVGQLADAVLLTASAGLGVQNSMVGTRQVTERERRSIWHNEEKAQEARRWLRTQERRPYVMGAAIGALATLAAAIVVALIGVWFK